MTSPSLGYTIFEDGKLKPGLYKIQNLISKTYLDIHEHSMEVCCRPVSALEENDGIERPGYVGKPDCFCTVKAGLTNGTPICITPFPVAWSIKVAEDEIYKGFEYVRIFWGQKNSTSWDLANDGSKENGMKVQLMNDERILPCRAWKFTPIKYIDIGVRPRLQTTTSTTARSDNTPPQYERETCCSCTHHGTENEHDDEDFGTTVIEVETVTKTTRKKYRVTEE